MLEYNKNYATLVLDCTLKKLEGMISALRIKKKCRNNNIK